MTSTAPSRSESPGGDTPVRWRVHLAKEQSGRALAASAFLIATGWIVGDLMQSLYWAGLTILFLFVSLRVFFLPTEYTIDSLGVTIRRAGFRQHFSWLEIGAIRKLQNGLLLRPRSLRWDIWGLTSVQILFGSMPETFMISTIAEITHHHQQASSMTTDSINAEAIS